MGVRCRSGERPKERATTPRRGVASSYGSTRVPTLCKLAICDCKVNVLYATVVLVPPNLYEYRSNCTGMAYHRANVRLYSTCTCTDYSTITVQVQYKYLYRRLKFANLLCIRALPEVDLVSSIKNWKDKVIVDHPDGVVY